METLRKDPVFDEDGYLVEPAEWTDELARSIARSEGLELGEGHWEVIRYMRAAYEERRVAPDSRDVVRYLVARHGPGARHRLFELFPYGYPGQACRIAGMKRPRAWSTG